jgi:transcriptional regulator with XRE-family HTH domain
VSTISARWQQIARSLLDKEYRDLFVIEEINTGLPFQIRAMRQARGWSQKDLADRVGMTQEGVSRLENPDYGKSTLTTLKRLASVFDVGLVVRFVPFSHLVDWAVNFGPEDLAVPDYEHDAGLHAAPDHTDLPIVNNVIRPPEEVWGVGPGVGDQQIFVKSNTYRSGPFAGNWPMNAEPDTLCVVGQ